MRAAILFLVPLGCNGDKTTDGKTTPTAETGATGDTGTGPSYEPTWDGVQQLFADRCDRCHPSVQYIDLHVDALYYVVPGDPEGSVLWQVLSQDPPPFPVFAMPYDTGLLPLATVDPVRVWIENGALVE